MYEEFIRQTATHTNLPVVAVDYRLAPETPFPGGVEDSYEVYKWLLQHGAEHSISTKKIVLMGDSAGGYIIGSTTVRAIMDGIRIPDACFFLYTWSCKFGNNNSHKRFANDKIIPSAMMTHFARVVSEGLEQTQRDGYSVHDAPDSVIKKFPRCKFYVGDRDPLLDDTMQLHLKFQKANVDTTLLISPGYCHGYLMIPIESDVMKKAKKHIKLSISDVMS
eukprot:CAMPEP_0168512758 /NCGR_PEP_ID=MMETSP0405-20121227/3008_1 /TAXON_ID=498012 /ORGANISM="Trichosphaerium sp, Strain Am-I-7 wt" /LENGTH=219 /DNA_ID=CAMNT_0008531361 /DNA_START=452 /DNA_END=1107 /DNA_ORIENTATION=+